MPWVLNTQFGGLETDARHLRPFMLKNISRTLLRISLSLHLLTLFSLGGWGESVGAGFLSARDNSASAGSLSMTGTRERGTQTNYPKLSMSEWWTGSPPCLLGSETQNWMPTFHLSWGLSHLIKKKVYMICFKSLLKKNFFLRSIFFWGGDIEEAWAQACLTLSFCSRLNSVKRYPIPE